MLMTQAGPGAEAAPIPREEADRVRLAANLGTPAAILRLLADDPAVVVRAAVALNPNCEPAAQAHMVSDPDERVRALLAGKVAGLLPGLSGPDRRDAQEHAHGVLLRLAADAAVRVRLALTEALQTMPDAPRAVIMRLAQDPSVSVSEPVLRLSPLLTDADLLELLASPPHPEAAAAVAGRAGLSGTVVDVIAAAADGRAIRALLLNQSASVRESTLDALIGRAGDHPEWHEPLVQRPVLAERAARALSMIVAGHVLDTLLARVDLSPALAEDIRARLGDPLAPLDDTTLVSELQRLKAEGRLTESCLVEAAQGGDAQRVLAILAVTGGIALGRLQRSVGHKNAKSLVSLVWKAGFSMPTAQLVQSVLGPFGPGDMLEAVHGAFPLSVDEMDWQIELLAEPGS